MNTETILEHKKQREDVLLALYDIRQDGGKTPNKLTLNNLLGLNSVFALGVLMELGHVNGFDDGTYRITAKGVLAAEQSLSR